MAFRFDEMPGSGNQTEDPPTEERKYYAVGSVDQSFVMNFAQGATPSMVATPMGVLYRQDIKLDWTAADYCVVTVPYGKRDKGSYNIHFSTTGGTVHITSSRSTVASYGVGAPNMKQTIGVNEDDVDGCDIAVPALKITVSFKHPQGIITMQRVKQLARNTAYVNSDEFLTFAAGEVLFLGADGEWGPQTETSIKYEFAMAENAEDGAAGDKRLTIGDIANIVKQGHDYAWIRYADEVDAGRPVKHAKHVYVERVYVRTAFQPLFGFGG